MRPAHGVSTLGKGWVDANVFADARAGIEHPSLDETRSRSLSGQVDLDRVSHGPRGYHHIVRVEVQFGFWPTRDVPQFDECGWRHRCSKDPVGVIASTVENSHHPGVIGGHPCHVEDVQAGHGALPEETAEPL